MSKVADNPIQPEVIDRWPTLKPEPYKHQAWNWRQDSFTDTDQWKDFTEGFIDENMLGMLYSSIVHSDSQFTVDNEYNVWQDEENKDFIEQSPDLFLNSFSKDQTRHIIEKEVKRRNKKRSAFWYGAGIAVGGLTDISSVFLFSKAAKPIWTQSRLKRANTTTKMLGAEELVKQSIDENRTFQQGATILGANYLLNLALPSFRNGMTNDDIYHVKNHANGADIERQVINLDKSNKVQIIVGSTNRWRKPDGTAVTVTVDDMPFGVPQGWTEISASMRATEDGFTIRINKDKLIQDFKNKVWTKPKMKGVTALRKDTFKSYEEYERFVLNHEFAHTHILRRKGETKFAYENRINEVALNQTKSSTNVPRGNYKSQEFINDQKKYLQEIDNESFANTILGKLGEQSNWNPIQAVVNTGNLTAIKFVKKILKSSLITKGNEKGIKSGDSLDQIMQLDMRMLGETQSGIRTLYKEYKKTESKAAINVTLAEFNMRVSRAIINSDYVDDIAQVMKAKQLAKDYYKYIGEKITQSNPARNQQIMLVAKLEKALKGTKGDKITFTRTQPDGTTIKKTMTKEKLRQLIDEEKMYLQKLIDNPLRNNYLNRLVRKGKIQSDVQAWRTFATQSLKRTMPELSDDEILIIVKSYEEDVPWQQFNKFNPDKVKDVDEIILDDYIFKPSGMSGNLKRRSLDIDQDEWMRAGYLESDIELLMGMYHKSVLPDVYLTSIFGTPNAMGGAFLRRNGFQDGLVDVAAEYKQKFLKAKNNAEKQALIKERDEILMYMESVRDLFKGTYGVSTNPSGFYSVGIKNLKLFNAMTSLQGGLASIVDLGRSVFFNGFSRSLKQTFESFNTKTSKYIYDMSKKEGRMSGELFEMQMNTRAMAFNDIDSLYNTGSRIEAGMRKMTGAFFLINLMTPWNQMIKTHQTMLIASRIIEECDNFVKGTITKQQRTKLAQAGIDETDAKNIIKQYYNYGDGVGSSTNSAGLKEVRLPKSFDWQNRGVAERFNLAVQNDLNIAIITPKLGDTPLWMSTQMGGLLAQFKKFSMGMTQRMLIRGLQEKDANFFGNIVMMVALGTLVDRMRAKAFNQDYDSKPIREKIYDGFERSGVGGIFMDVSNIVHRTATQDMGGKLSAVLGPTGSQLDKIYNIISSDDNSVEAQNVRRLLPYQNIWYLDSLFDRFEQGMQ